jgi:hypothetical protein
VLLSVTLYFRNEVFRSDKYSRTDCSVQDVICWIYG